MSNLKLRVVAIVLAALFAGQGSAEEKKNNNNNNNNNAQRARPKTNYTPPQSLSPQNLQENLNLKGIASQNPQGTQLSGSRDGGGSGQGGGQNPKAKLMGVDGETGSTPGKEGLLGEGKSIGSATSQIKSEIGDQGPVTGAKYGDTFGGGRVNNDAQSGGTGNFRGGGKGNAAESDNDKIYDAGGNYLGTRGEVTQSGKDQASGGYSAKDVQGMKDEQNAGGFTQREWQDLKLQQEKDRRGGLDTIEDARKAKAQQEKELRDQQAKKTPRDDDMGSGGAPMGRQDVLTNQRGMTGRTQGAGGKGDGRTDQQAAGGGGPMISRDKAEGIEHEAGTSSINMDKALEINQKVNPGRQ